LVAKTNGSMSPVWNWNWRSVPTTRSIGDLISVPRLRGA
jgi:hypothetical protein